MKKIEEVIALIEKDDNLKKEFAEAIKNKTVVDFLNAQDCKVTEEDVEKYLAAKKNELSDEDLDKVSGAISCTGVVRLVVLTVTGVGCVASSIAQKVDGQEDCKPQDVKG